MVEDRINNTPISVKPSLPRGLRLALQNFRDDSQIVIKLADKNLGLVLMDKTWYIAEVQRRLSDSQVYLFVPQVPCGGTRF